MDASQDRREFKFLLHPEKCEKLRKFISENVSVDRGAEGGYPVVSEYFDTHDRHSYWQKVWGAKNRRRVRARVYGRSDGVIPPAAFIEIKHKSDAVGVKRRVAIPIESLAELSQGEIPRVLLKQGRSRADQHVVEELRDLVVRSGARPVVQVRYDRMAYDSGPDGTIRVTFDTGLRCRFDLEELRPDDQNFHQFVLKGDASVVEVKTIGAVPIWLRDAIGRFGITPVTMSKYSLSLEQFDPAVARVFG